MARGRFQKKRSPLGPILIILVLAAIAAAVLYFTGVPGAPASLQRPGGLYRRPLLR